MKIRILLGVASAALVLLAASPTTAQAQCAKCEYTGGDPCRWGPFADVGYTSCIPLGTEFCLVSGDYNITLMNDPMASLEFGADGFVLGEDLGSAVVPVSNVKIDRKTTRYSLNCLGLAVAFWPAVERPASNQIVTVAENGALEH